MFFYPMIALTMAAVTIPFIPLGLMLHGCFEDKRRYK